ncbi:MAG: hypothetical protein V1658_02695 [Candidatus Micrarchaeota archaeon]
MKAILYIEDSRDTADAVKILLSSAGFETDTAANGREGLQAALLPVYIQEPIYYGMGKFFLKALTVS